MARTIQTHRGPMAIDGLERSVLFEARGHRYTVAIAWYRGTELLRVDRFELPRELGPLTFTTEGDVPIDELVRTEELTDTPARDEVVLAVSWTRDGRFVRRDAHVIKTEGLFLKAEAGSVV